MADLTSSKSSSVNQTSQPGFLKCLIGALIAGALGFGLYRLTQAIALSFAEHPLASDNQTAITISIAVRTLVVGVCTMGTGVFGIAALGLLVLGIQSLWKGWQAKSQPPSQS